MANFKKISKNIQSVTICDKPNKLEWLNVKNAKKREIKYLRTNFNFNLNHLRVSSTTTKSQRPIIDHGNDYSFVVIHFPIIKNDRIKSEEIEFFVGKNYLISLHQNAKSINSLFNSAKKDSEPLISSEKGNSKILLYEILKLMILECYTILDKNSEVIEEVEDMIFEEKSKEAVSKILILRRNIINIRKTMENHKDIIKNLIQYDTDEESQEFYNELFEHSKKIWNNIENQKELIAVLNTTNESLLNYRLNDIMKTLTIFSVIVFPLTLLAGIFGMNLEQGMPLINTPNGFWIIISIMGIGCLGMILFFKKKNWM